MTDEQIIDIILKALYENIDDYGTPVKNNILKPYQINIAKNQYARIIKILISDKLAERAEEDSIGGDDDLIISKLGIDIIKKFDSYSSWLKSNSMGNTTEEIELMDKVFNYYIAYEIDQSERNNPNASLFANTFKIDQDFAQHIINEVAEIGNKLGILTAQKHGYGSYSVVRMDKFKSYKFRDQGGFKTYFKTSTTNQDVIHYTHNGDNYGNVEQLNKIDTSSEFSINSNHNKTKPDNVNLILTIIGLIITALGTWFAYKQL